MPPAFKSILGAILLILGLLSLLQFGFQVLLRSPGLIMGILLTAAGAALLTSGRGKYLE